METKMTKIEIETEHKVGRYGSGFYATVFYQQANSSGSFEVGPYANAAKASDVGTVIAEQIAA